MRTRLLGGGYCHEPLLRRLPLDSSYVVSYCSPTRYCSFPFSLFLIPALRAYCTGAYCHVHVYRTVPLLPGDLSFDLLSPGKPSCISLCTYFAQYIHLSPVLSVELCSSLYCSQSAGTPACLALGSSSSLNSSRNNIDDDAKYDEGGATFTDIFEFVWHALAFFIGLLLVY